MPIFVVRALEAIKVNPGVTSVHRGAVLPEARVIVIAVPLCALLFYLLVVRRHSRH